MSPLVVALILLGLGAVVAGGVLWQTRWKRRREEGPILLFETQKAPESRPPPEPGPPPVPSRQAPSTRETPTPVPSPKVPSPPAPSPATAPPSNPAPAPAPSPGPVAPPPPDATPTAPSFPSETVEAGLVRFERAAEGTLQLLPGRFVIQSDAGRGEEIRFVRVPGAPAQITFGRSAGPPHRHVQLQSPTVSRLHAELNFDGDVWTLRNHSSTNPTLLNGRSLGSQVSGVELQDGDRVEMGEVTFLFHKPEGHDRLATRSSWHTDRALRAMNQDAVLVRTLPGRRELAAVCDGMGSHEAGGVASRLALETLADELEKGEALQQAVERANAKVRETVAGDPALDGMGTTLVALLREEDRYTIANVGDSRAYQIDDEGIRQITHDHSFVAEAMASGEMSEEEALRSPWRHAITRNLGGGDSVKVDLFEGAPADSAHVVVLCSDGVHGVLDAEAIARVVQESPHVRDTARLLCEEAIRNGTQDNVSAAVVAFGGGLSGGGSS
jgi:PPM family protein phosphatase